VTIKGKETLALKGLTRPFPKLKALDMEEVIESIKEAM